MVCLIREFLQMYVGFDVGHRVNMVPHGNGGGKGGDHSRRMEFGTTPPPHHTVGSEAFLEAMNLYATSCICFPGTNISGKYS